MSDEHLCLTDLLDQDLTAYEFFQTLPGEVQASLRAREVFTFDELQSEANRLMKRSTKWT